MVRGMKKKLQEHSVFNTPTLILISEAGRIFTDLSTRDTKMDQDSNSSETFSQRITRIGVKVTLILIGVLLAMGLLRTFVYVIAL